jgi:hypothetical protein
MRVVYCSEYLQRREADAYARVQALHGSLSAPGMADRVRAALGVPSQAMLQRQVELQESIDTAARLTKGRAGEDLLVTTLARRLDDHYLLFAGYPGRTLGSHGDVDGILVGPHGVTIYEVKAWSGFYTASDEEWRYHPAHDDRWEPAHGNPNQQALRHAQGMKQILRQHKLKQNIVYPTVAIASDRMHVEVAPPMSVSLIYLVSPRLTRDEILGTRSPAGLTKLESEQIERLLLERLPVHKRTIVSAAGASSASSSRIVSRRQRISPLRVAMLGGAGVIVLYILILVLVTLFTTLMHHH